MKPLQKYPFPIISSVFLTISPILFSSAITIWVISYEKEIEDFGLINWFLLTIFCCFSSMVAITPPTFLALIFGYFLGFKAIFLLFLLNMVAIFLVNQLTKKIDKDSFRNYISQNQKVKEILESIRKDELKLIFFTKLSPILPFALMNFVFALSGAKLKNILLGGFFGMIPRTILAVWVGSQAKEIKFLLENTNSGALTKILLILLLIISVLGIYYLFSKSFSKK